MPDHAPEEGLTSGPALARYLDECAHSAWDVVHERFGTPPRGPSSCAGRCHHAAGDRAGTGIVPLGDVDRILVEHGRAAGAVTRDGREFRARRAIMSSMHATALPDAIGRDRLPRADVERLERRQPGLTLFAAGRPDSSDPWLLTVCSSLVDPSRVPGRSATLKPLTIAPYERADGSAADWDDRRDGFAELLVARFTRTVRELAPGDELGRCVQSPLDLAHCNPHNVRGSCHGGAPTTDQSGADRPVPGWSRHRLPIPGWYQTGASTHPGGSVSGRPGRNAARVVLRDLGVDPAQPMVDA